MQHWFGLMAAAVLLAGCVPTTGGNYSNPRPTYNQPRPSYQDDTPSLTRAQRDALADGCKDKYGTNGSKRRDCVNQNTDGWRDALIKGCYDNYRKNEKFLRRCLAGI